MREGKKYDDPSERGGESQHDIKVSECHMDGTNPAAWGHAADSFNITIERNRTEMKSLAFEANE